MNDIRLTDSIPPIAEAYSLFESTGWNKTYRIPPDIFETAIEQSWRTTFAHRGSKLVGMGRIVSDGALYAVLFDIIVDPHCQRAGVGSQIVRHLLNHCHTAGIRDILLFSAKGTEDYYRRFGFVPRPADAPGMILRVTSGNRAVSSPS